MPGDKTLGVTTSSNSQHLHPTRLFNQPKRTMRQGLTDKFLKFDLALIRYFDWILSKHGCYNFRLIGVNIIDQKKFHSSLLIQKVIP